MNLIMRANMEVFKEARNNMCEALMELMEDVIEEKFAAGKSEGKSEGRLEELLELVSKKLSKGKTIEQIADDLEKNVSEIENLIKLLDNKL